MIKWDSPEKGRDTMLQIRSEYYRGGRQYIIQAGNQTWRVWFSHWANQLDCGAEGPGAERFRPKITTKTTPIDFLDQFLDFLRRAGSSEQTEIPAEVVEALKKPDHPDRGNLLAALERKGWLRFSKR